MAINFGTANAGSIIAPNANYPYGKPRDIAVSGDDLGTAWNAANYTELQGFLQAILSQAGITPDGNAETALVSQYLRGLKLLLAPVGVVRTFYGTSAPSGYLKCNGQSIGNAASGATARANADTLDLFTHLWNSTTNTILQLQNSAGGSASRGASAAADFAANRRLALPELRAEFVRGLDDGRGIETRTLGSAQAQDIQSHTHSYSVTYSQTDTQGGSQSRPFAETGANTGATGGTETRPRNVALLYIISY